MKFIPDKATDYLSVKLPYIGAVVSLLVLLLQAGLDLKLIPLEYQVVTVTIVLPLLAHLGRKIAQPTLGKPDLDNFAIQPLVSPKQTSTSELSWIAEARKHVGLKEDTRKTHHNTTILKWLGSLGAWWKEDETPWCGVFVAYCLKTAGVFYPKDWYRALAYVNYGTKLAMPAYGCIAVKTRKGGGHVCFVVGKDKDTGKLVCIGGNQNNMVSYALYAESDFQEFRWYGKTLNPAHARYNLPELSGVTATKVTEA